MKLKYILLLVISHGGIAIIGFALGIYMLPILIAPDAPTEEAVAKIASQAMFSAEFKKDLKDSDGLHWGQGKVAVNAKAISFAGELAPGPDYKVYLSPKFVETEVNFNQLKPSMIQVGEVKTFNNFIVNLPQGVDVTQYNSVIVWCETFGQFITAGQYQ